MQPCKKPEIALNVQNNTNYPQQMTVLGSPIDSLDTANAKTECRFDVTGFTFTTETALTIQYKPTTSATWQTYSSPIGNPSLQAVVTALNGLGIGYFNLYTELGYTYIGTYNDNYTFDNLNLYPSASTNGTSGSSFRSESSGLSALSGTSGSAGTSGTSGIGTSGTSGTSGISGLSVNGSSGDSGASGVSGTSGTAGISGTSGTSGTSGSAGSSGAGTHGTAGLSGGGGVNGSKGTSGSAGTSGTAGISGMSGSSGSAGISGLSQLSGISGGSGLSGGSCISGASGGGGMSGVSGNSGLSPVSTSGTINYIAVDNGSNVLFNSRVCDDGSLVCTSINVCTACSFSQGGFFYPSDPNLKSFVDLSLPFKYIPAKAFTLNKDVNQVLRFGYNADEVYEALPSTVAFDDTPQKYKSLNYIDILVIKVQMLENKLLSMKKRLNKYEKN